MHPIPHGVISGLIESADVMVAEEAVGVHREASALLEERSFLNGGTRDNVVGSVYALVRMRVKQCAVHAIDTHAAVAQALGGHPTEDVLA